MDAGAEHNVAESPPSQQPTRRQSNDLTKRRARKSKKSDLIDEIRGIVGVGDKASKLEVLNAGAGFWSIAIVGLVIHRPHLF